MIEFWHGFIIFGNYGKTKRFYQVIRFVGRDYFLQNNGDDLIRTTGGVDKNRIKNDPAFKRTCENMSEFGGSATVVKALRMGFTNIIKSMSDNSVVGRITGVMKKINSVGTEVRGQRGFEILPNKILLEGFEFSKNTPLDTIFYAPTLDTNRSIATWVVPDFNTSNYINPPEGATHFKLVLITTVLSDFNYSITIKKYEPVNAAENETNGIALSTEIPLGGMVGSDTTLVVDLGFGAALATVGVANAIGIIFYQEINTQFYELVSDNVLRISIAG